MILMFGVLTFNFAQTQYYSEDLEAGQPTDWELTGEFIWGDAAALTGPSLDVTALSNQTNFIGFNDDAAGGDHMGGGRALTGPIDLTAVTGPLFFEFDYYFINGDYGGADEIATVSITRDGGATFTELADLGGVSEWKTSLFIIDDYAGETVQIAFDYDDGGGWNWLYLIDNLSIADEPINAKRRDYTVTINGGSQFGQCAANIEYPLEGLVINRGYEAITSFDINLTLNGATETYSFDGMDIGPDQAGRYIVPEMISVGEDILQYEVSIANVNGEAEEDEDVTDNAQNLNFIPNTNLHPSKAVVVEEATGTWCTWCPRGTVYLDEMSKRFGHNFVGIAVHNNDPMALTAYDDAITGFAGFTGFPSVVYNRSVIRDPGDIVAPSMADMAIAPMAAISVGAEENGPILKTSIQVDFMQDVVAANHRVSIVISEDAITGEGAGWNQVSGAYSGGANGPMGGFEYLPSSVPSELWPYDHVGRALIGGFAGVNNVVVGDYAAGDVVSNFFQDFVVPTSWNKDNLHIIGILTNAAGQVMNASSVSYNDAIAAGLSTSVEDELLTRNLEVYPNPVTDNVTISLGLEDAKQIKVSLLNALGQRVSTQSYGTISGNQELSFDMSVVNSGIYYLNVQIDDQMISKRVTKQ